MLDLGVVMLDSAEPQAYCVAGRPDAIVVTSAALDALAPDTPANAMGAAGTAVVARVERLVSPASAVRRATNRTAFARRDHRDDDGHARGRRRIVDLQLDRLG
ncbi:hypothetical protein ACFQZZ_04725 [Nocardia sp. GCM10030253]|uniref:hypothetical protein n=1 Tax=Nocardia sp. GCM10030253 TaxID=3273404 RepID=UPI003638EDB5